MRKLLIAMGFVAMTGLMAAAAPAAAQGFGQVTFGTTDAAGKPTATPPGAPTAAGHDVDGLTVTGKRIPDSQKDPDEVLCHEEVPMGTRFPKKICATRRAYAERKEEDRWTLEKLTALRPGSGN